MSTWLSATEIRSLPNWREPCVGEDICVPSSFYISHGRDDFQGGVCKIAEVIKRNDCPNDYNRLFVKIEERPGSEYNWLLLIKDEESNRERYGSRRGFPDPDYSPEFNEW